MGQKKRIRLPLILRGQFAWRGQQSRVGRRVKHLAALGVAHHALGQQGWRQARMRGQGALHQRPADPHPKTAASELDPQKNAGAL